MRNFREYDVWIDGRKFVNSIYDVTDNFPNNENFGLTSQLNRASVSIVVNIAEGASRKSEKEFLRFLEISLGSAFEVETLILIASDRNMTNEIQSELLINDVHSLQKRINGLMRKIKN